MKSKLLIRWAIFGALVTSLTLGATFAIAAPKGNGKADNDNNRQRVLAPADKNKEKKAQQNPGSKLLRLLKQLNLTPEQVEAIKAEMKQFQTEVQKIRQSSQTNEQKMAQIRALRETHRAKLESILTPEQQNKLNELIIKGIDHKQLMLEIRKQMINATPEQREQVKAIRQEAAQQVQAIKNDASLDDNAKKEAVKSAWENALNRIKVVLGM